MPTRPSQVIDVAPLIVMIRAAVNADATIAAAVPIQRPEIAEPQDAPPYLTFDLISAVRDSDIGYAEAGIDCIIQATLVTVGSRTDTRTAIMPRILAAVLDVPLAAPGYTIVEVTFESQRLYSDMTNNVVRRYGAIRFRVRATKP